MKVSWVLGCVVLIVVVTAGAAVAGKEHAPPSKVTAPPVNTAGEAGKAPAPGAKADVADPEAEHVPDGEADAAAEAQPSIPHIVGPKLVELGHHAQIDLPAGMYLLEQGAAQDLMRKLGNSTDQVVAAVVPASETDRWLIVIDAIDAGYVDDSDAGELDSAEMLEQFKRGTIAQNKQRVAMGMSELFLDGWSELPRYERGNRHLVWGLNGHDKDGKVVNFFTRFLGRNGYLSVDLIDDPSRIAASKAQALSILTALRFTAGFRYEDHIGSDHDSGLGLKALVLGGTGVVIAKKTGILIAILLALKKGIIVVAAAIGGFFKWLFGRRKRDSEIELATSGAMEPPSPPPPPDLSDPPVG